VIEFLLDRALRTPYKKTARVLSGLGIQGKKVEFLREVSQSSYKGRELMYFELEKQDGKWRITAESDEPTDDFFAREKYSPLFGK
jgi:hypothetical protein